MADSEKVEILVYFFKKGEKVSSSYLRNQIERIEYPFYWIRGQPF